MYHTIELTKLPRVCALEAALALEQAAALAVLTYLGRTIPEHKPTNEPAGAACVTSVGKKVVTRFRAPFSSLLNKLASIIQEQTDIHVHRVQTRTVPKNHYVDSALLGKEWRCLSRKRLINNLL